jgi:hypothetical protein
VKLDVAIGEVRDAEIEVAQQLNVLGERHKADHDVFHVTETLQRLTRANLDALVPVGERYDVPVDAEDAPEEHRSGFRDKARERTSELLGRRPESGLLLLRDLRKLHLLYAEASINWVLLAQGAQAAKDADLLDVVSRCHPQTLRGMKWTVTRLKEAAPQALTS